MEILTIIPPIAAIVVAIVWRNVYAALLVALFLSETLIASFNPGLGLLGVIDRNVAVFESAYNTQILIFCLMIGSLIAFMRDSGGVSAMAHMLIRSGIAGSRRKAELAVAATGTVVFIETNVSLLSSGVLGRPLYDSHGLSRERLAYIIDSTSAPVSVLILLNGWGAYALSLVADYGFDQPLNVVLGSIPWNFYAILTLFGVYFTAISGKVFGPLKTADEKVSGVTEAGPEPTKAIYMWLPLVVMVAGALSFMAWTGNGSITDGDGAKSILWAIALAIVVAGGLLFFNKVYTGQQLQEKAFEGIGEMVPMVTVLLMSIALGGSLKALGTGDYIASIAAGSIPAFTVPVIMFIAAALTSFMTGTSWGTYGILVPIAMPLASALGVPPSLALAAVLGGGVFGDHSSPISDTSLIASVASGSEHLSHVRTQLPYALAMGGVACVLYLIAGLFAS
ncbi:Na+/H+ antiporter NhaC family protein [Ponticaulis sp.]|uniref:Na+/H+ antiporter NhaC family protein n=1 Tax=Ponticaulis sp. TaxID=2020902 RepID=UPI000B6BE0C9|nr:Na+/H+ antiporter NhaC family protein [Ponticaulis sp.]MAI91098.1 sodium:proton antiporter [Ponticaulis sp.]OUX98422.1 MAG: sodium:proton antiporter [Hyphomonadaceae bacterium TMED5]|tara:strand:- start:39557 stop:40909 length:1353 start_codon:yes stop_codon:yes gene_type:complete